MKAPFARARAAAMKFTDQLIEAGHAHPGAAAAVLLGTGMLLGSLAHRLARRPTSTQRITRALRRAAASAARALLNELFSARKLAT